jgi:iron complex outermembrane receptor protein
VKLPVTGNTIQNHQVGYSPSSFYVYEQAYGADAKPLDVLLTETKMESLTNKINTVFKTGSRCFLRFNTSVSYKTLMGWSGEDLGVIICTTM